MGIDIGKYTKYKSSLFRGLSIVFRGICQSSQNIYAVMLHLSYAVFDNIFSFKLHRIAIGDDKDQMNPMEEGEERER